MAMRAVMFAVLNFKVTYLAVFSTHDGNENAHCDLNAQNIRPEELYFIIMQHADKIWHWRVLLKV